MTRRTLSWSGPSSQAWQQEDLAADRWNSLPTFQQALLDHRKADMRRRESSLSPQYSRSQLHIDSSISVDFTPSFALRDGLKKRRSELITEAEAAPFRQEIFVYTAIQANRSCGCAPRLGTCPCLTSEPVHEENREEEDLRVLTVEQSIRRCLDYMISWSVVLIFIAGWVACVVLHLLAKGYINKGHEPVTVSPFMNTYIDETRPSFKCLIINNTRPSANLEIHIKGPFAQVKVLKQHAKFNFQFERLWFHKDNYKDPDVKRHKAIAIEVDHSTFAKFSSFSSWYSSVKRGVSTHAMKRMDVNIPLPITYTYIYKYSKIETYSWCNLKNTKMNTLKLLTPYNLFPYEKTTFKTQYAFADWHKVPGRIHSTGHRVLANKTNDSDVSIIYSFKYALNNTKNNSLVAFALNVVKGTDPKFITTTTTPEPKKTVTKGVGGTLLYGLMASAAALLILQANRWVVVYALGVISMAVLNYKNVWPDYKTLLRWMDAGFMEQLFFYTFLDAATMQTRIIPFISSMVAKMPFGVVFPLLILLSALLPVKINGIFVMLFLTPITLRTCELMQLRPRFILITLIMYCNLGSMIDVNGNYALYTLWDNWTTITAAYEDYDAYTIDMLIEFAIIFVVTSAYIFLVFCSFNLHRFDIPHKALLVQHECELWQRLASGIVVSSQRSWLLRKYMMYAKGIREHDIKKALAGEEVDKKIPKAVIDKPKEEALHRFESKYNEIVIIFVYVILILIFTFSIGPSTLEAHVISTWKAIVCTGILLILLNPPDVNLLLCRIPWVLFFAIFVLSMFGYMLDILRLHKNVLTWFENSSKTKKFAALQMSVTSGILAGIFGNYASTPVLVRLADGFAKQVTEGVDVELIKNITWGYSIGTTLGACLTVLGSGPAIVCLGMAAEQGYEIGATRFLGFTIPVVAMNGGVLTYYYTQFY